MSTPNLLNLMYVISTLWTQQKTQGKERRKWIQHFINWFRKPELMLFSGSDTKVQNYRERWKERDINTEWTREAKAGYWAAGVLFKNTYDHFSKCTVRLCFCKRPCRKENEEQNQTNRDESEYNCKWRKKKYSQKRSFLMQVTHKVKCK